MSKLDYHIHDEADARGSVLVPDELQQGELVAFRPLSAPLASRASTLGVSPAREARRKATLISDAVQHTMHGSAVWLGRPALS